MSDDSGQVPHIRSNDAGYNKVANFTFFHTEYLILLLSSNGKSCTRNAMGLEPSTLITNHFKKTLRNSTCNSNYLFNRIVESNEYNTVPSFQGLAR